MAHWCSAVARMKGTIAASLIFLLLGSNAFAQTKPTLNLLAATEFGGGLGAGVELGGRHTVVLGLGTGFGVGHSSATGWFGDVRPGLGVGYRRYLGDWFLGPTVTANYRFIASAPAVGEGLVVSGLLDFGHRWMWKDNPNRNTKFGFGGGIARQIDGGISPVFAVTLSIGFGL